MSVWEEPPPSEKELAEYVMDYGRSLPPDHEGIWLWLCKDNGDTPQVRFRYARRNGDGSISFLWPHKGRDGFTRADAVMTSHPDRVPEGFRSKYGTWLCAPLPWPEFE